MTTPSMLKEWFEGAEEGTTHMVVICDSFDYEDYPVYCKSREQAQKWVSSPGEMQRVMEVYDLSLGWEAQSHGRVWNL